MDETPIPSMWEQTTTRRFLRWLFSARTLRRSLIALAWIASLIALYYGVTNWRGRHAWNEYRHNYEAHVAPLDVQAYIPKLIPDSENFAATPFVQSWMKYEPAYETNFLYNHDAFSQADNMVADPPKLPPGRKYEKHFQNLVAWQEAFTAVHSHAKKSKDGFWSDKLDVASRAQAAPDVVDGMKDDETALDELRAASVRPDARYLVVYDMENPWGIHLIHLLRIKQTCKRLEIKACAELASGQNENALEDVKLVLYLTDSVKTEPFLISYLVRIACVQFAIQPIWEGLAEHRWTEAQLQQLQARLEPYDFLADLQGPSHAERAFGVLTVDLLKKNGLGLLKDFETMLNGSSSLLPNKPMLDLLGRIIPSGWYEQEKLHFCQHCDDAFQGSLDQTSKRVFPRQIAANAAKMETFAIDNGLLAMGTPAHGPWHAIIHHETFAVMMSPALGRLPVKAAAAQTAADQAAVACALERYRLANGQFPDNLQALVPRFAAHLPNDVISGEPFKYRRTDDGRFVLYSVGWNEKDDGGVPGKTMFDETEGDWVWEYPMDK
jgi:hypothetical protein